MHKITSTGIIGHISNSIQFKKERKQTHLKGFHSSFDLDLDVSDFVNTDNYFATNNYQEINSDKRTVKVEFNSKDWVFTQATAVASVNTNPEVPYQITTDTIKYVNANGNSWETNFLKKVYRSFIGAMNLKDHIEPQAGGQIYGIIIDAIPRKIKVRSGFIYYIDTMIATNKHTDPSWARAIQDGKIKFLSVGFVCDFLQCTKCGHIYLIDGTGICEHCQYQLQMRYKDYFGRISKVSAMATDNNGTGKAYFDELSYLSVNPAFSGACQSYKLDIANGKSIIVNMPIFALDRPAMRHYRNQYKILDLAVRTKNNINTLSDDIIPYDEKLTPINDVSAMLLNRL